MTTQPATGTYVPYEYSTVTVASRKAAMYRDALRNFGWELVEPYPPRRSGTTEIRLRRNRDIRNRSEVIALQDRAETALGVIGRLERSQQSVAAAVGYVLGGIGTVLLGLSVFSMDGIASVSALDGLHGAPSVALGVIGLVMWALAPAAYLVVRRTRARRVRSTIERQELVLRAACEQATHRLEPLN